MPFRNASPKFYYFTCNVRLPPYITVNTGDYHL